MNRARKLLPGDALDNAAIRGVIGRTVRQVLSGETDPGVAHAIANLCRVGLAAIEQDTLARLTDRVGELEALATEDTA